MRADAGKIASAAMSDAQDVPTGRLGRMGRALLAGGRTGLALLGRGDGSEAATRAVELLGSLRGLAAKVGQMASYVDGFIPEAQSAAFASTLSRLQAQTPASPFEKVQALIEEELAGPLSQHFAMFESEPMASASIGQVHRARLHDGRAVAVKVQHPGIAEAMEADLTSAAALANLASTLGPRAINADEIFRELAARFREELDYRHEAQNQARFAELHADDPRVHIPRIIASHTRARVMTSELVVGLSFAQAASAPAALRRSYAELLWSFVSKSLLIGGVFNADPHPGNYIFHDDGRITFLDFGCTQAVSETYVAALGRMRQAAIEKNPNAFAEGVRLGMHTQPGSYEQAFVAYLYRCYEPLTASPYHLRSKYVADVVRETQSLKAHMLKRASKPTPLPPDIILLNRLQFGFYSVLARLDVAADYAAIDRALLSRASRCQRSLR